MRKLREFTVSWLAESTDQGKILFTQYSLLTLIAVVTSLASFLLCVCFPLPPSSAACFDYCFSLFCRSHPLHVHPLKQSFNPASILSAQTSLTTHPSRFLSTDFNPIARDCFRKCFTSLSRPIENCFLLFIFLFAGGFCFIYVSIHQLRSDPPPTPNNLPCKVNFSLGYDD